jgi:hypothetical protein
MLSSQPQVTPESRVASCQATHAPATNHGSGPEGADRREVNATFMDGILGT